MKMMNRFDRPSLQFPENWCQRWRGDKMTFIEIPGCCYTSFPPLRITIQELYRIVGGNSGSVTIPFPRFTLFFDRVFTGAYECGGWDYRDYFEVCIPRTRKVFTFGPNYNNDRAFDNLAKFLVKEGCIELVEPVPQKDGEASQ